MKYFEASATIDGGGLRDRNSIDDEYIWKLEDIYNSEEEWNKDFEWLKSIITKYSEFKGKLSHSGEELENCLKFEEEVGLRIGKLHLYSMLAKDLDLSDTKFQGMYDQLMLLLAQVEAAGAFIRPEMLSIPEEKLNSFIADSKFLNVYKQYFADMTRTKEHTLDDEKEMMLANLSPALQTPYNAFSLINNADFQFPKVKNEKGEEIEVSHGRYGSAMYSLDRDYRKRFYEAYYKPYKQYKNTIGALFSGNIKGNHFTSSTRKYNSSREASLDANNIPVKVYDNLVNTVEDNLNPLHRWCALKKKVLGVEDFHAYDIYVTLFPSVKKEYSYEEGKNLVFNSLKPLGEKYLKDLKYAFDNRWVDVFETKGKRSGAYSSGTTVGVHPYVLLNWNDQLNDVFTLTHEMGHNMHSHYTGLNQPFPYANYSIFVAEVASTLNEALLLDYLIDNIDSKEIKLALLEKHINSTVATFYRQTLFASFEETVHRKIKNGEPLTPDYLCGLYGDLHKKYWGNAMTLDEEETYTWARVPHFYYNFYVYQYATSYAASEVLVEKIKNEGEPAVKGYLKFLEAGSSDYPINVLKKAGVDMLSPEPILAVTKRMNSMIDKLETIL